MAQEQDWEPVVFKSKKPKNTPASVAKARQSGEQVETNKKFNAGGNKQHQTAVVARKLEDAGSIDEDSEKMALKKISRDQAKAIQQARMEKKWTQKDLAREISERQSVVNEYEQGKAVPSQQVLRKMERKLGVKLTGKNVGEKIQK